MIEVAHIDVTYHGDIWQTKWRITPEAHGVGLAASNGGVSMHMGDDLCDPAGATKARDHLRAAVDGLARELAGQWGTAPLF